VGADRAGHQRGGGGNCQQHSVHDGSPFLIENSIKGNTD
jgi:hypothetical protein